MSRNGWIALLIGAFLLTVPLSLSVIHQRESISTLCHAERAFIQRQERQSQRLLSHGVTFGIPKAEIPILVQQSRESQERFLADLSCG